MPCLHAPTHFSQPAVAHRCGICLEQQCVLCLLCFAVLAPQVILMAGLQGTGKTTAAGKLALLLKKKGLKVLLVATDVYRPGEVAPYRFRARWRGAVGGVLLFAGDGAAALVGISRPAVHSAMLAQPGCLVTTLPHSPPTLCCVVQPPSTSS